MNERRKKDWGFEGQFFSAKLFCEEFLPNFILNKKWPTEANYSYFTLFRKSDSFVVTCKRTINSEDQMWKKRNKNKKTAEESKHWSIYGKPKKKGKHEIVFDEGSRK